MDKKEFGKFAMTMKTFYPKDTVLMNDAALELWYGELQDIPSSVIGIVLRKWVATNKWAPTIADIREMAVEIMQGDIPDWSEAWEKVLSAVHKYNPYDNISYRELLNNESLIIEAVDRIGFMKLCNSENISIERATFRTIYEQIAEKKKREYQLPADVKIQIAQTQNKLLESKEG